jgi:hypothetical protein
MIIQAENKFWSDEKGVGVWVVIDESRINYDIWTREPNAERIAEMKAAMRAGFALDEASRDSAKVADLFYSLFDFPTPNYDACRKGLGADLDAMEAYESFRLASLESEGQ